MYLAFWLKHETSNMLNWIIYFREEINSSETLAFRFKKKDTYQKLIYKNIYYNNLIILTTMNDSD